MYAYKLDLSLDVHYVGAWAADKEDKGNQHTFKVYQRAIETPTETTGFLKPRLELPV
jgi:hypothetical protein